MFINGGVSAHPVTLSHNAPGRRGGRAPYELPNSTCYNETCGQIGVFMWGYRMLVNQPDASFADIMEREMFNGFLPCLGLDGRSWFYRAVLRRYDENYKPTGWTDMVQRGIPGRNGNLLSVEPAAHDGATWPPTSTAAMRRGSGCIITAATRSPASFNDTETFALEQITDYPWSGDVKLVIRQAPARTGGRAPARARLGRRARRSP